jgi:glycosyltransferase involved in cell wall biosynthesis
MMTAQTPNILVVIPLYNHAATVRDVVERTLRIHDQVLVVDDGSSDAGSTVLEGLDVQVIRHPSNRGKGEALRTAFVEAERLGFSHVVTLDADGQHFPEDLPLFFTAIEADLTGIIVGKRDFEQTTIPGSSRFGRKFSNFWLRVQTGKTLADSQSGFRAYPVKIVLGLPLYEKHYSFEIEVLVRAAWAGVQLHDVDIQVFYPSTQERISHFRGFMDNFRLTLLNTKLTFRSVAPWPHRKLVEGGEVETKITAMHPLRSIRALLVENATPAQLAAAGALGILFGALPLLAVHTIAILLFAGFFRLNKVAAVGASQLCMPPLVPGICIEVGYFMRNGHFLTEISIETLGYQALDRLYEWFLGSLVFGPVLAAVVALIIYLAASTISREMKRGDRVVD